MFVIKLLHFLQGYVKFEGRSQSPDIFINSCTKNYLNIWDLYCDKDYVSACVVSREYKSLRHIAKKSNSKIHISSKHGLPFKLSLLKKRKGLLVGLSLFFIIIYVFSNFIWSININVDKEIDTKSIESSLNELGIKNGAYSKNLDLKMIEKEVMLRQDDIAWLAINLTGSVVDVEISMKTQAPSLEKDETPCNLIASEAGQIIRSEVLAGQKEFTLFQAVEKDQILVNGIVQSEEGGVSYKHSQGKVFALVRKNICIKIPFSEERTTTLSEKISRAKLNIFNLNIPILLASRPDGDYQEILNKQTVVLFNKKLPLSLITQQFLKTKTENIRLSVEDAKQRAQNALYNEFNSVADTKILHSEEIFEERDDEIILNASVLLEKNIAQESSLAIEYNN